MSSLVYPKTDLTIRLSEPRVRGPLDLKVRPKELPLTCAYNRAYTNLCLNGTRINQS